MADCVHHWKQKADEIKAPFVCMYCGAIRDIETNFHNLIESRANGPSPWRGDGKRQESDKEIPNKMRDRNGRAKAA